MASAPPLPAGYTLDPLPGSGDNADLLKPLFDRGVQPTNGYRTPADIERLKAAGYTPAEHSRHLDGDAVDLVPGSSGLSWAELHGEAQRIASGWQGARVINEGDHIHLQLPGWGQAPGTPGTKNFGLPALPDGYQLEQRGALRAGNYTPGFVDAPPPQAAPPLPPGYSLDQPAAPQPTPQEQADAAALIGKPSGALANMTGTPDAFARPLPSGPISPTMTPSGAGFTSADAKAGKPVDPFWAVRAPPSSQSYQAAVDPKKNAQLQAAYDSGASVKDLVDLADSLGIQFEHGSMSGLREAVNSRDKGGPRYRFSPENAHQPTPGPMPGESTPDYYRRMSGGQTFDGPYTLQHPAGRTLADNLWQFYRETGIKDPDEGVADARMVPIIGGAMAISDAKQQLDAGHPFKAASGAALGALDFIPGPGGKAAEGGVHVIDSAFLRAAAAAEGGAVDMAKAGTVLRSSVDEALSRGGSVTLHIEGQPRQIVATNEGGLLDAKGRAWPASTILAADPSQEAHVAIKMPKAAAASGAASRDAAQHPPEAVASDLPQEAPNEQAVLGGPVASSAQQARDNALASQTSHFTVHDPIGGDGPEGVKFVQRPNGDSFILHRGEVIDTSAMTRAGSTPEQTIAQHIGEDTTGRNVVASGEGGSFGGGGDVPPVGPPSGPLEPPQPPRQRDYLNMPPLPRGYTLDMPGEQSALGFTGRMDEPRSAEEMAALARRAEPESFTPIPSGLVRSEAEAMRANPGTQRLIDGPEAPGRAPARPSTFADAIKSKLAVESRAKGMPVRIDAEDAIDKGVPADLVYLNPNVADKSTLRLRYPSIFGTRYGKMTSKQQHLISLDMDGVDPVAWGFDHKIGQRLDPEDIGDLLGRSLHGDPSALERGPAFDAWTAHQEAEAARGEFAGRFPDGAPVEHIGSPVTLNDLRANEPPATAYEDLLKAGGGKVANINIDNLNTGADIQRALEATEAHFGGFDAARRGVRTHAETEALANEAGMTADDLLRRRHGQALNAEQALRARQILAKSSEELTTMARNMANWTPEERQQFAEHLLRHAAIYEHVTGATAEAGRALESFKIGASSKAYLQTIHRLTAESGRGSANVDKVARMIVDLHKSGVGPGGVNRFAAQAARPSTITDKLLEVFYNSILSAPSTHAINMLGNTVSTAMSVPEYALASAFGALRGGKDRVFGAEVGGYIAGLLHGTGKGFDAFKTTLKTGVPADAVSKVDTLRREAIPGIAGKVIRTPSRFLTAEDELFKGIARQGAIGRLAARQAAVEGLKGDALAKRAADLAANPPERLLAQARDFARYMTFQKEPGRLGKALQQWTDDYPALKFLIPFIRTQENLVKFAAERSPVALLMPSVRADLKAGGAKRDLALAKIAIGSMTGFITYEAARRGIVTGGDPIDGSMRDTLHQAGWQPYSIKLGDRYVSYRRLDPLSLTLSVAADLATYDKYMTPKERSQGASILAQMMSRNLESSFWMESVSNLMKLVGDPLKEAPGQAANIIGALAVPNIIAQPTSSMDPVQRKQSVKDENWFRGAAQTILNRVEGRIPGLRQTLPVRTDAFGAPMKNDGRLGPDIISPFQQNLISHDPAYQSLIDNGLHVDVPGNTVNKVPLTPAQHRDYVAMSGRYIKDDMEKLTTSPEWEGLSQSQRKDRFEQIKRDARADARADLGIDSLSPDDGGLPPGYSLDGSAAAPQGRAAPMRAPPPLPKGYTLTR